MKDPKSKGTILIVDDEPDVVFFISKVCQPQGYHTLTAGSGHEALKLIRELNGKIDLILLDLRMPGMGGLEVLRTLRKDFGDLPVIILTALAGKKKECEALGIEAFMTKPYSLEELYQRITTIILQKKVREEALRVPSGFIPSAKIMIVDDEKEICETLAEWLKEDSAADFKACFTTRGDEVLKIASEFKPDIVILDVKLQHHSGDELIDTFKTARAFCPKDFMIFSGSDIPPDQKEKLKKEGYLLLSKLAGIETLVENLKRVCVRHKLLKKIQ